MYLGVNSESLRIKHIETSTYNHTSGYNYLSIEKNKLEYLLNIVQQERNNILIMTSQAGGTCLLSETN